MPPPNKALVYSFFTSELAPMLAKDALALLRQSNASIDPKLLELVVVANDDAKNTSTSDTPAKEKTKNEGSDDPIKKKKTKKLK
jgi:hypothetical protein